MIVDNFNEIWWIYPRFPLLSEGEGRRIGVVETRETTLQHGEDGSVEKKRSKERMHRYLLQNVPYKSRAKGERKSIVFLSPSGKGCTRIPFSETILRSALSPRTI